MSFSPGQFITAQRLNRLQPKPYWAAASATVAASATNADIPGCSISITVETNAATAVFSWSTSWYYGGVAGGISSSRAVWDVNTSPVLAISQGSTATDKMQGDQFWQTSIGTAGTYTFKLQTTTGTLTTTQVYSALSVIIYEVA